ncbi:MAG: hypothetical protein LBR93_05850 [Treponema sp.]|jgi:hypothetical protein|nr:hypothetical protein [Treponema sp.]
MSDDENKTMPILIGVGVGIFILILLLFNAPASRKGKPKRAPAAVPVTKTTPPDKPKNGSGSKSQNPLPPFPLPDGFKDYKPGIGWQDKNGEWHYMDGVRRSDGLVYWRGNWVSTEKTKYRYPRPKDIPYEKRKFINAVIAAKIAAEIDYGGTGVQYTDENSIDCEDYAIKFWLNAKDQGYDARILTSNTIHHAFNSVVVDGNSYLLEPQAGEENNGDVFKVDGISYGNWRGSLYDLTDIADNTNYYVECFLLNSQSSFKNNGPTQ